MKPLPALHVLFTGVRDVDVPAVRLFAALSTIASPVLACAVVAHGMRCTPGAARVSVLNHLRRQAHHWNFTTTGCAARVCCSGR